MHKQFQGRAEALAAAYRVAQAIHRTQWLGPGSHQQPRAGAGPEGGDVHRDLAVGQGHVVHHPEQGVVGRLQAGRVGTGVQGFEEFLGQSQVLAHPAFGGGVGQVEVQPAKPALFRFPGIFRRHGQGPTRLTGGEMIGVEQPQPFGGRMQGDQGVGHGYLQRNATSELCQSLFKVCCASAKPR